MVDLTLSGFEIGDWLIWETEIWSLVDPLFESEISCKEKLLPSPHVGIQFPFLDRNVYAGL